MRVLTHASLKRGRVGSSYYDPACSGARGAWIPRKTIAEFYGLKEAYLAKYLQRLVAEGVLLATTGPRGGYRLAAPRR